jgi:hypothetical protein
MTDSSRLQDCDVRRDSAGRPTKLRCELALPSSDEGDTVLQFLSDHADALRLPPVQRDLKVVHEADTPTGRIVRLQQQHEGIPVLDSEILVVIDNDSRVKQVDLAHQPQPQVATDTSNDVLKPQAAVKVAEDAIGPHTVRGEAPQPEQVFYPAPEGLRLAYVVMIPAADPPHDWRFVIDAHSGAVLEQRDLIVHVNGSGMVFDPNPVVTSHNAALRDPDAVAGPCGFNGTARATIDAQRVTRTLRGITLAAGKHKLDGPFVRMQNFGAPSTAFPQEVDANAFKYSSGDDRFEAVNAYYHIDTFQRYLQDGTQGPSVTTAHNSQIAVDPHEGSGAAFYSPLDKGLHFSDSGPCRPDRGEDGHVMVHEYGHAIQDNQVPGWGKVSPVTGREETGAMGEGYGDAMACIFFSDHGGGFEREVFEQWVFGDQGGLRRVDGTKVYPGGWTNEVHNDGEIWSAALWNIYRAIGGDSASPAVRSAARHAVIKTVTLSHHRMTKSGTMPDGAEAVMSENAALNAYLGRHLMQMLDSFHARGVLPCSPKANLTITDGATFYNSPDLWVRNHDDPVTQTVHQGPEFGQDNFFYARVTNKGTVTARAFVVTFNVKPWAGTEFVYPNDFVPYVSAACGFNLAPGQSTVVKAKWPAALVPPKGTHACWLASVYTPVDTTPGGKHVWEHDNLAQKNMTILNLAPNDSFVVPVQFGNLASIKEGLFRIEVKRPPKWREMPVAIVHKDPEVVRQLMNTLAEPVAQAHTTAIKTTGVVVRFLEPAMVEFAHGGSEAAPIRMKLARDSSLDLGDEPVPTTNGAPSDEADLVTDATGVTALALRPGATAGFPIRIPERTAVQAGVKISVPDVAQPGDVMSLDVIQRDRSGQVVGGVVIEIRVAAGK